MSDLFEAFRFEKPGAQRAPAASESSKPERPSAPTTASGAAACGSAQPTAPSAKRRGSPRAIEYEENEEPRRGDAGASTTGPHAPPPPPTGPCFRAGVSAPLRTSAAIWRGAGFARLLRSSGGTPANPGRNPRQTLRRGAWLWVEICSTWEWRRRGGAAGAGAVPLVQEAQGG